MTASKSSWTPLLSLDIRGNQVVLFIIDFPTLSGSCLKLETQMFKTIHIDDANL